MSETITIKELCQACINQIKAGNGDKKILLSGDDEGNSYHEMFFLFTTELSGSDISDCLPYGVSPEEFDKDYVILG